MAVDDKIEKINPVPSIAMKRGDEIRIAWKPKRGRWKGIVLNFKERKLQFRKGEFKNKNTRLSGLRALGSDRSAELYLQTSPCLRNS